MPPSAPRTAPHPTSFVGSPRGPWRILEMREVRGPGLPPARCLDVVEGGGDGSPRDARWILRGVTGHERYTEARERTLLEERQAPLGRRGATRAALIPIAKSDAWWSLAQDERRRIFEERSHHITTGLRFLPAIARRLYHARDLGEPFDFLTWFEYAPEDAEAFESLVRELRSTEEWRYVIREVDVRLQKDRA